MDKQDTDRKREEYLGSLGYRVIRFNNNQVMQEMYQVYEAILSALSDERL
jgi:very-short-patch-repair endonuclease